MPEPKRSESAAGFHFYSKYMNCPRSWYIQYVLGLVTAKTPKALPFGGAIHHALHTFRVERRAKLKTLLDAFVRYMLDSRDEYADDDEYQQDLMGRGPIMLQEWYDQIGLTFHDHYRVVEAEQEWVVELYSGDKITVRLDSIIQQLITQANYIIETKTSSWSQTGAAEGVIEGDQASTYLLAAERVRPDLRIQGVIPEILYNKGKVTKVSWFEIIYRSQEELRDWEDQLVGLVSEVSQKRAALGDYPLGQLFPRNPVGCSYAHRCSYPQLCRRPPSPGVVPAGYRIREVGSEIHSSNADADRAVRSPGRSA